MTQKEQKAEILKSVKLRPGMSNLSENLLIDFIEDIYNEIIEYINIIEGVVMPVGCISIVKDLVVIKVNRIGSEGISSDSHEGVSQSYSDDIPKDILRKLRRYRRLPI